MGWLQDIDLTFFFFFNGLHSNGADIFFYFVSHRFFWIPLYLIILIATFYTYKKKAIPIVLLLILTIFLTDQSCNVIKRSVQRVRPSHQTEWVEKVHLIDYPDGKVYKGGKFGFPSSHAANSMALALFVILFLAQKRKWIIFTAILWVLLVSYSRIYLGVHYPSDLLGGYVVGAFWMLSLGIGYRSFYKKRGTKTSFN